MIRRILQLTIGIFFSITLSAQTFTNSVGGAIPDGTGTTTGAGPTVCFPVTVTGVGTINGVTKGLSSVCMTITHGYVSDLFVYLVAPDGLRVPLVFENGGDGVNFTNTCFSMAATNPIDLVLGTDAPFTGSYLPTLGFDLGFINNGQNADGVWTLCCQDRYQMDAGNLVSFSLNFNTTSPAPPVTGCNGEPLAANRCTIATPICVGKEYCSLTDFYYSVDTFPGLTAAFRSRAGAAANITGNSFYKFKASATTANIEFTVFNQNATPSTNGIEVLVFGSTCSAPVTTYGYTGNIPDGPPVTVNLTGLTVGNDYTIMIDPVLGASTVYIMKMLNGVNVYAVTPALDTICVGQNTALTASGGNGTYTWSPATGLSSTSGATVTAAPTSNQTYTITHGPIAGFNCPVNSNITTVAIKVNALPIVTAPLTVCTGNTANLTPTSFGTWATSNATLASVTNAGLITGLAPGSVTFIFTDTNSCAATTPAVTVTPPTVTPTFNAIAPFCAGTVAPLLPTTSTNGVTGTWSPATVSNTTSGTYTFTPTPGQCAAIITRNITVNTAVTPTFNPVPAICSGTVAPVLPTTSTNAITGTWSPATVSNTASGTYTFTPTAGQCATTTTINITVNPVASPTVLCGNTTINSIVFNWNAVAGATNYTVTYTINGGAPSAPTTTANATTYTVSGLSNGDNVTITVTPTGTGCFSAGTQTCTATACVAPTLTTTTPTTVTQTRCINTPIANIGFTIGGAATSATATGLPPGVTGTLAGTVFTISGTPTSAGTFIYTVNTVASCGTPPSLVGTITVNNPVNPTFNPIPAFCVGTAAPILPTTSTNGITGTWSPAVVSNAASGVYQFTPNAGQCANNASIAITVTPPQTPTFNTIAPICVGAVAPILPTTSTNGITGTWSPAVVSNVASGAYTFTPNAGQCASNATINVTVNPATSPTFNSILPFCAGTAAPVLPTTSTNGITGTWNPAVVNNINSGSYTFTPNPGQCAAPFNQAILVIPAPVVELGNDTLICNPNTLTLNATNPVSSYLWQNGATTPTFTVTQPGNYNVVVTNALGCITTDDIDVTFSSKISFNLGRDTSLCNNQTYLLNSGLAGTSGIFYNWQDGSSGPTYTVSVPGIYYLDVTNECGPSRDSVVITPGVCRVYVPNAFSPNNDGKNDLFIPLGTELVSKIDVKVFNRYGQLVFNTDRIGQTWNGKVNGVNAASGIYVYLIKYTDSVTNKEVTLKGTLMLMR